MSGSATLVRSSIRWSLPWLLLCSRIRVICLNFDLQKNLRTVANRDVKSNYDDFLAVVEEARTYHRCEELWIC